MTSSNLSHGIISILLLAVAASAQESGRWRYGAISWKRKFPTNSSSRMVTFTVESAWRLSHGSIVVFGTQNKPSTAGEIMKITGVDGQDPILSFGDGNMTAKFDVEVLRVDPIQDMVVGVTNIDWEYGPGGPWLANLTLCCRVAGNQNANKGVLLTTKVDLSSADMIGSPYVRMMPLVSVRLSEPTVQQFLIPAASARGFAEHDSLSWSMMPASYYNALYNVAPNTTIVQVDAMTGMVSFDVSCFKTTCTDDVEVVFVVQDTQSNSFCTVDVIVHVQRNTQVGPTILLNGPPNTPMQGEAFSNQTLMPAIVGFEEFPLKLTFSATDPDFTKILYFEFNTLPLGLTETLWRESDLLCRSHGRCEDWKQPGLQDDHMDALEGEGWRLLHLRRRIEHGPKQCLHVQPPRVSLHTNLPQPHQNTPNLLPYQHQAQRSSLVRSASNVERVLCHRHEF
mmetsp:Transcript_48659/g.152756  ORF Transcript_48659/g.152756 Transcript_48659/m.152756 type:complete len:452 (-) Transcript_48659:636-1991(-)